MTKSLRFTFLAILSISCAGLAVAQSVPTSPMTFCDDCASLPSQSTATPTTTTTSTGTKIGTIVKDAVSAAFPAVGQILSLIWPSGTDPKTKVDKTQAETKAAANSPQLQSASLQTAKNDIKQLGQISAELALIEKFGKAAVEANEHVTTMQALLSANPPPTDLLGRLQEEWGFATDWLGPLASITDDQISIVSENAVQVQLKTLRDAPKGASGKITNRLKDKKDIKDVDLPTLTACVTALAVLLNGTIGTATVELDILQKDITSLVAWANSAEPIQVNISLDSDLLEELGRSRSTYQRLLSGIPDHPSQ
jgi:hypothetical protein